MEFTVLDSCAHMDALERTRQGPFSIQDCLKEHECTISGIQDKIHQLRQNLDEYLDIQMNKYRSTIKAKSQKKSMLPHVKRKHNGARENEMYQYDQWNYAK